MVRYVRVWREGTAKLNNISINIQSERFRALTAIDVKYAHALAALG